jgi:hypothetical protein
MEKDEVEARYWSYAGGFLPNEHAVQSALSQAQESIVTPEYTLYIQTHQYVADDKKFVLLFESGTRQHYVYFEHIGYYKAFMREYGVFLPVLYMELDPLIEKFDKEREQRKRVYHSPLEWAIANGEA